MKFVAGAFAATLVFAFNASGQAFPFTECGAITIDDDCTLLVTDAGDRYELVGVGPSAAGEDLKVHGFLLDSCENACDDVVACVLVSNINECDDDEEDDDGDDDGEDGPPEFFDCEFSNVFYTEWPLMAADLGLTPNHSEFPGQHIPLRWGLAMAEMLLCHEDHPHHEQTLAVYETNLLALTMEPTAVLERIDPFKNVLAAALLLGPVRQERLVHEYGLMNTYEVVRPFAKSTDALLSDDGDLDGDGFTNADEYLHVISEGASLPMFLNFAASPGLNAQPLPASGGIGLTALVFLIVALAVFARRQNEGPTR